MAGHTDRGRLRRHATPGEQEIAIQLEIAKQAGRSAYQTSKALEAQLFATAGRASALTFNRGGQHWTVSIIQNPAHVRIHRRLAA